MATRYNDLIQQIDDNVNTNGQKLITGAILNDVLQGIVSTLGSGYRFAGVVDPEDEAPTGDIDGKCYIAREEGTYTNFDNITVHNYELCVLYYDNEDEEWHKMGWERKDYGLVIVDRSTSETFGEDEMEEVRKDVAFIIRNDADNVNDRLFVKDRFDHGRYYFHAAPVMTGGNHDLQLSQGYIIVENTADEDERYPYTVGNASFNLPYSSAVGELLELKQDVLTFDSTPTSGSTNPVTSGGIHTAISDFVTRSVSDLANYYLKADTYTKGEVQTLIADLHAARFDVVSQLPVSGERNVVYLVPSGGSTGNVYNEYIYVNNRWEQIGGGSGDLSNYYTKTQTDNLLSAKANNNAVVHKTGNETIGGVKTFYNQPIFGEGVKVENNDDRVGIILSASLDEDNQIPKLTLEGYISDNPELPVLDGITNSGDSVNEAVSVGYLNDALATKQDSLTFDTAPTENSANPVTSGGIYAQGYVKEGDSQGSSSIPSFDAYADTVHITGQTLSTAQKTQARENINAQEALVSGTNIKTINGTSILGDGNISVSGGATIDDTATALDKAWSSSKISTELSGKQDTISDLATIRSGAAAGATAVQPVSGATENNFAALNASGNVIDSGHKNSDYATAAQLVKDEALAKETLNYLAIEFDCSNVQTGKCLRPGGSTLNVTNGAYCLDYLPVIAGMKIMYQASGTGNAAAILCYDDNKALTGEKLQISSNANYREWTIPDGTSYIRISTEKYTTRGLGCYVKADKKLPDIVSLEERASDLEEFHTNDDSYRLNTDENFYISDTGINPFALNNPTFLPKFKPSTPKIEFKYNGQLNNEKRYATLGFDDFRTSDFAYMIPMLNKYGAKAEFNLIKYYSRNSLKESLDKEKQKVLQCAFSGQEIGDHTFRHQKFPFSDPMWNGQNPASLDGTQTPFPTNSQMRDDYESSGKNYFGISLSATPYSGIKYQGASIEHTYGNLTDDECQAIRNWYSLFGDIDDDTTGETGHSNLLPYLDTLSNMYLGTTGSSKGSWVDVEGETNGGHYTGGIYTGMHSSANEEIWERYMQLVDIYTKDLYGYNGRIKTWSMPGSKSSMDAYFFFYGTDPNIPNAKYYDINRTIPLNYNARWESATLKNNDGTPKVRSMTELLREFGYVATHDYDVPGRIDYLGNNAYQIKFFPNADFSQINGVGRFNNYELYNSNAGSAITGESWFTVGKQRETDMYDRIGWYRAAVDIFRHYTANGRFAGLIADVTLDSTKIYGYMSVFEGLVRYCKSAGIELLTTQEAYDAAFHHRLDSGNLIYNPYLRNTAKEFLSGESSNTNYQVEDNPDGYLGTCSVEKDQDDCNVNVLVTAGDVRYEHWGIPYGHLKYTADVKGEGTITIYEFKNKTALSTWNPQGTTVNAKQINLSDCGNAIATKSISSAADYSEQELTFDISNNDLEQWTDRTEDMGDKVIGIIIVYSTGLRVKNIRLNKIK